MRQAITFYEAMDKKQIAILGSTGSIGTQALQVIEEHPDRYEVYCLTANNKVELLAEQARRFKPAAVVIANEARYDELRALLADQPDVKVYAGAQAIDGIVESGPIDMVLTAMVGFAGLSPTIHAIKRGKTICLANKETLVVAGELICNLARRHHAAILPVDSEHSAIFQCLTGREGELHKILLTGSGGPFRGWTREQTRDVTSEMAVRHPNWSMGAKISVDSATMMNKGLEFIEAMHLFGVTPDDIQVLIHPESVVHSMVELLDGTVIAQLGVPDMGLPIQYALTYPERKPSRSDRLDFTAYPGGLHFYAPDLEALPCLALAMQCARTGGTAPTVMNAANEIAVGLFLGHKIGYHSIYESVAAAVDAIAPAAAPDLDVIRAADQEARAFVRSYFHF